MSPADLDHALALLDAVPWAGLLAFGSILMACLAQGPK